MAVRASERIAPHSGRCKSDPAFTLRIYAHLMPDAEQRALQAIEKAMSEQDHGSATAQGGEYPC